MYPTIYHALKDLIGLDLPFLKLINSFGFFVVLAFMAAAYTLSKELERKQGQGWFPPVKQKISRGGDVSWTAYISSTLLGAVLGFKLVYILFNADTALADPPSFLLSTQGSLIGALLIGGLFFYLKHREVTKEKEEYPERVTQEVLVSPQEHASALAVQAAIWGFIGAKLFYIFEDPNHIVTFFTEFSADSVLSGLTVFGGLILGAYGIFRYFKKNGIPPLVGLDATAPGFLLAYGIGRIGCHVSGDGDWGIANPNPKPEWLSWLPEHLWSYNYPNNVNAVIGYSPKGGYSGKMITEDMGLPIFDGYGTYLDPGVYPTPLYELAIMLVFFSLLWSIRKRVHIAGVIFFLVLLMNGVERFFIEKIRVNDEFTLMGMKATQAEIISVLLVLTGLVGMFYLRKKGARI